MYRNISNAKLTYIVVQITKYINIIHVIYLENTHGSSSQNATLTV